jgi:signal transduction histidine kinase
VIRPRAVGALKANSLVGRLIWLAAGWSLMVLVVMGVAITVFFREAALRSFNRGLEDVVIGLYAGVTVGADGRLTPPTVTDDRFRRAYSGKYWEIAEAAGPGRLRSLVRSKSLWDAELPAPAETVTRAAARAGSAVYYDGFGPNHEPLRAAAMTVFLPGHAAPVTFLVAENRAPVDRDVRRFAYGIATVLVLLGAGLVAAVFIQVRVGLRPLFVMGREVAAVRTGKRQRLSPDYPPELAPLAHELNALLDHNQEVVERQRTHVGNLAHALKTPISVMLTEASNDGSPLSEVVKRQADTMRSHVEHHLRRARAAARAQGAGERTPLPPVLDELARPLARIFQDKGVQIDWDAPDDLSFAGERQDLLEIAGNVIENACKWSRARVRVNADALDATRLRLVVEDDGPGLPPEARAEVLKRGARMDESAPGSGLGLSIVDELARAYGGSLALGCSPLGGLRIELRLPRAEG